jgi:hypothetical protein
MTDNRKEFEAALLAINPNASLLRMHGYPEQYDNIYVQSAWEGFQLARSAPESAEAKLAKAAPQSPAKDEAHRDDWNEAMTWFNGAIEDEDMHDKRTIAYMAWQARGVAVDAIRKAVEAEAKDEAQEVVSDALIEQWQAEWQLPKNETVPYERFLIERFAAWDRQQRAQPLSNEPCHHAESVPGCKCCEQVDRIYQNGKEKFALRWLRDEIAALGNGADGDTARVLLGMLKQRAQPTGAAGETCKEGLQVQGDKPFGFAAVGWHKQTRVALRVLFCESNVQAAAHREEFEKERLRFEVIALYSHPLRESASVKESLTVQRPDEHAKPTEPGMYAWVPADGAAALVLVNRRHSAHSPGGVLNGHCIRPSEFYDGAPVESWGRDGRWILLRAFPQGAKQ